MATVTEKEVLKYYPKQRMLQVRIVADGQEYFKELGNIDPAEDKVARLDAFAIKFAERIDNRDSETAVKELEDGIGDWASRPEGPLKQSIAQQAIRKVVEWAREGKILQANGPTRPDAFCLYAKCRSIRQKIWLQLDYIGNHAAKAAYLDLDGPGANTEYGDVNAFMNDLGNSAADWDAVITFMANCTNPQKIVD